jgi:hypothetical protein
MESFEIGNRSDVAIRFHERQFDPDPEIGIDSYLVTVFAPGLEATVRVENPDFAFPVSRFFDLLAANWHEWKPDFDWSSVEGELHFSASADKLGHVSVTVVLSGGRFGFPWSTKGTCVIEAGQLESIAQRSALFLGARP